MAGEIVMAAAARKGVKVLPVDSEHNAIFQCLDGRDAPALQRIILTCSGRTVSRDPREELEAVTPEMALKHPTWSMGRKISIDSATLFNKGLEMIEARWLFNTSMEKVDVVIHPQSVVHSMVEFVDGSLLAQLGHSDMCFPIQYAVTWPERVSNSLRPLGFRPWAGSISKPQGCPIFLPLISRVALARPEARFLPLSMRPMRWRSRHFSSNASSSLGSGRPWSA